MVWGSTSEWFWTMAQFLAVVLSLWFIYRQVKLQRLGNMVASLANLKARWHSPEIAKFRHTFVENTRRLTKE